MLAAKNHATLRTIANRGNGVANRRIGPQGDDDIELVGIIAEIAWAKWRNVYFDISVTPRAGSWDNITKDKRVDIKATRHPNGRLLATAGKSHDDVDIFVLGIVNGSSVNFVGWASRDELIRDGNLTDLGHGKGYALDQSKLHPLST